MTINLRFSATTVPSSYVFILVSAQ